MAKEDRTDKEKNKDLIAAEYAKDPHATVREVSERTGVSKSTVAEHKKTLDKFGQKDERIISLTDKDFEIMLLGQQIISDKLQDQEQVGKMNVKDVSSVVKDSAQRYTLFRGNITDDEGGLKENKLTDKQQEALESLTSLFQK